MDGAEGSQIITDSSPYNHIVTVSNCSLDTAKYKFGTASCRFNSAGTLSIPRHDNWALEGYDFWIDFQVWFNTLPQTGALNIISIFSQTVDASNGIVGQIFKSGSAYYIRFYSIVNGSYTFYFYYPLSTLLSTRWFQIALGRKDGTIALYQNGTQRVSLSAYTEISGIIYYIPGSIPKFSAPLIINGGFSKLDGWLDEFQWIKGRCLQTASFTVPTTPYNYDFANRPENTNSWTNRIEHP